MITRYYKTFLAATCALVLAVFCLTVSRPELMKMLFSKVTYFLILALFLIWVYSLGAVLKQKHRGQAFKEIVRPYLMPLAAGLFFSIMVFSSIGTHYRVLSDETNLLGDAKAMFDEKIIDNVTMGE